MRQLSGPGSQLIATCADKELQLAHQALPQDHYFAASKVLYLYGSYMCSGGGRTSGYHPAGQA